MIAERVQSTIPVRVYISPLLERDLAGVLGDLLAWGVWEVTEFWHATPPGTIYPVPSWGWGSKWADIPLAPPGSLYFFPCVPSTDIRGCMWNRGASVMVCRPDTREVLELRTVHELLHALLDGGPLDTDPDLPPADNMHAWIRASAARCLAHTLTRMFGIRTEAWQRRYYRHLIQAWRNSNV